MTGKAMIILCATRSTMNYVGHLMITFPYTSVSIGNLLGDMVRNRDLKHMRDDHQLGVNIHREIDRMTDQNPTVRALVAELRENHGKYAPVTSDILLDYAFCQDWETYDLPPFDQFESWIYNAIESEASDIPIRVRSRVISMARHGWLQSYRSIPNLTRVLKSMDRRAAFESHFHKGILDIATHGEQLSLCAKAVHKDIREKIQDFLKEH